MTNGTLTAADTTLATPSIRPSLHDNNSPNNAKIFPMCFQKNVALHVNREKTIAVYMETLKTLWYACHAGSPRCKFAEALPM